MDLRLAGRRALVTGSSSGLGEAIARLLAAEGVTVVVHGRDESRANGVAEAIRAVGGDAVTALGDLATDAGADAVTAAALADGPIDILVNNAGAYEHLSWADATPAIWAETYNVNVISGVRMIQRLVPPMKPYGYGVVISADGEAVTAYATVHRERTYAQARAGVTSRVSAPDAKKRAYTYAVQLVFGGADPAEIEDGLASEEDPRVRVAFEKYRTKLEAKSTAMKEGLGEGI